MEKLKNMRVGDIVTDDFRTAEVFKEFGIDFCCGGNVTLESIADEKKIRLDTLVEKLTNLDSRGGGAAMNYKDWAPDFLSDYIVNQFHQKVYRNLRLIIPITFIQIRIIICG